MESEAPVAPIDPQKSDEGGAPRSRFGAWIWYLPYVKPLLNWENYFCASTGIKETRVGPDPGIGFKEKTERHLRNADRSKKKRDNPTFSAAGAMAEHGGRPKGALALLILILGRGNVVSPTPQHQPPMIPSPKINSDYAPPPPYSPQSPIFPPKTQYPPLPPPPPTSAFLDAPPSPSEDDQSPDLATQPAPG